MTECIPAASRKLFPLQLAVVILVIRMQVYPSIFYSPIFFVLFVTVLILLSFASHKYLEIPAQRWIRANFTERGRRLFRFIDITAGGEMRDFDLLRAACGGSEVG
jgi:peptidoglycan/LPS O-acetylase OafA/YrhL